MRTGLAVEDLEGFLDERHVAVLATHRADGSVLLSPVWHEWRDGGFQVWVGRDDVKARHVRRDPRASIVVAESSYPMRAIEVRGEALLLEELGRAYVTRWGGALTLRLAPGELRAWDYRDEADTMEAWT
jgi:PPOX class probable F420-dependent enzyme